MNVTVAGTAANTVKRDKVIYWVSTGIIAALMLSSALNFAFNEDQKDAFRRLGLPDWFRIELTVAKLLGVLALVARATPALLREFAYFGFGLTIISADIAHLSSGDSGWFVLPHSLFFVTLIVSYVFFHKLHDPPQRGARAR
ncbi:DoxX family protein [Sorangium sp. So ce1078]|uniref:DoxX family protein n=1 Tax=Sorangium sp. So ce1078 TaxID=3133329 RepID=UPI003F607BEB